MKIKTNQLDKNRLDVNSPGKNRKEFIKNNKLILKPEQRFRSKKHNVFTEEVNKILLIPNNEKYMHFKRAKN